VAGQLTIISSSADRWASNLETDMEHQLYGEVRNDIVALVQAARAASARSVNALVTATYWDIGRRIVEFEQRGQERAECGDAVIKQLAADLEPLFGRGFGWRNLTQMRAFFVTWPASKILQTPSAKSVGLSELAKQFPLPWSAYVRLLSVESPEARAFYEAEALRSGWSIRQLDRQIGSQFCDRRALRCAIGSLTALKRTYEYSYCYRRLLPRVLSSPGTALPRFAEPAREHAVDAGRELCNIPERNPYSCLCTCGLYLNV